MFIWPFYLAAGFAVLDWASTWKGWKKRLYIAKPATLVFLMLWTLLLTRWQGDMLWYGIALVFSLLGDILLMLNPRFFLYGLGAFLLTHVFYLVAFNQAPAEVNVGVMLIAVLVGVVAARVLRVLRPGILKVPKGRRMLIATTIYAGALALMVLSALLCFFRPGWPLPAAILVSLGALLFFISDSTLTYDRFVRKLTHGQSLVHFTYHLGQFLIITGALIHFSA